jgi:hypothetical protein
MDNLILVVLIIGPPLLLFLIFFAAFKYIYENRMHQKARIPQEYYVLLFLIALGCSFFTFIGFFSAWYRTAENSILGLAGIINGVAWMLLLLIPILVFVSTFLGVLRLLEKRIKNLETATGNHYIATLVIAATAGGIALLGVCLLTFILPRDMSPVQAALDAQCGTRVYVADPHGYSNDPYYHWIGYDGAVSCDNMFGEGWTCTCPTPK